MKTLSTLLAGCFAAGVLTVAAQADEFIEDCETFKADNGIEGDCACMAEASAGDPAVKAELMATTTLDDLEGLSEAAQAVVDACT